MKCKVCNQPFIPASSRQIYCSKKCQRIGNLKQQRAKYHANKKTPYYVCQNCGHISKLPFYPVRSAKQWLSYRCPKCKKPARA